ncbi:MAG: helix-turn-helix domain-containing protein, partial [Candidatus Kapaibacteriota bacterium]
SFMLRMPNDGNKEKLLKLSVPDSKDSGIEDIKFLQNWKALQYSQSIAVNVILKLKELGMTQRDLAEKMNVKPQVVNRWLSGKVNFTLDTLFKFEQLLGLQLILVNNETQKQETSKTIKHKYISNDIDLNSFSKLNTNNQKEKNTTFILFNRQPNSFSISWA